MIKHIIDTKEHLILNLKKIYFLVINKKKQIV